MEQHFHINVNGEIREVCCDPDRTLLDVLREDLRLTGTKRGCDIGVCGTCTVLIDGKARRACRVKMGELVSRPETRNPGPETEKSGYQSQVSGLGSRVSEITTIEGLAQGDKLHPIQQAFIDCGAIQCGFCTPGMVMQTLALLTENPNPSRDEIKKAFTLNLCRCTGYQQIFEAVEEAARIMNRHVT